MGTLASFRYFRPPYLITRLYSSLTWRMRTDAKELYLTFDDGPVPGPTDFVLDTLKSFNATATFFLVGENIYRFPHIYSRLLEQGHRIGNHTHRHVDGWKLKTVEYMRDVEECQAVINAESAAKTNTGNGNEITSQQKPLFRPPFGHLKNAQVRLLKRYNIVMWDVLTYDFDKSLASEECLQRSVKATRNGSIVVFHDSYKAERNLRYVLPRYIEHFMNEGYTFRSL